MQKEIISADHNGHNIIADILPAGSVPQVFCMHGAGVAQRKLYDPLRKILSENNISSCAIDFLGYGETGGDVKDSSLQSRTEQAELIINQAKVQRPLILFGSSMGGYNAIKLAEIYEVKLLVLIAPGIFDKDAYGVHFGDNFSAIIRQDRSWDKTDAWGILNNYKGKILVVAGENDNVVPSEIFQKIYTNSNQASSRELIIIPEAPHQLMTVYFPEHPEDLKMVADKIIELMK